MLGLGSYESDASDEDEPGTSAAALPLPRPALDAADDDEEESADDDDDDAAAAGATSAPQPEGGENEGVRAEEPMIGPVIPLALSQANDDDDDEDDDDGGGAAEDGSDDAGPSGLPPPDFSDFPDPADGGAARPAGPQITALTKRERPKGGSHQISSGFKPGMTRRDQLNAKAEAELDAAAEARSRNNGLSSAYDSVFRVPESDMTAEELDQRKRMRTTKKGGVRMISKKEAAREAALEASLM